MITTVRTKYGILQGVRSNAGFSLFRGVPFAATPVGQLRWKAPMDPLPWEGVRICDTYGPACAQFDRWDTATDDITDDSGHPYIHIENYPYPPKMSEDCLYLNIYTPAESENEKLPVMMYIHGGGCQQWYGSDYEYCGDNFCKNGCILVSINYRLNVFGFYTHPELSAESGCNASGNYGLMDQIQALKWIHENIAGFGGDPENITIFGQSAGGGSCLALWSSPLARKYIRHVSVQSAGGVGRFMGRSSLAESEKKGIRFMEMLGCKSLAEMRQLPWETLRNANDTLGMRDGFNICVDGYVLPKDVDDAIISGENPDVDIIIGCTADEGANEKPPFFGFSMVPQIQELAEVQLRNGKKPVHVYVFDREQPGDDVGIPHSCDNRYQFGTLDGSWRPYTEEDWTLSSQMTAYWANFAKTGDPNGEGLPHWEAYTEPGMGLRLSTEGCTMRKYPRK